MDNWKARCVGRGHHDDDFDDGWGDDDVIASIDKLQMTMFMIT